MVFITYVWRDKGEPYTYSSAVVSSVYAWLEMASKQEEDYNLIAAFDMPDDADIEMLQSFE